MLEEKSVAVFCFLIDQIVRDLSKGKKSGRSYNSFLKAGLTEDDMYELWKLDLIDYDENKPSKAVWIVWKNIQEQRIQWKNGGFCIPVDCNELKKLGTKKYRELYLTNL